jgi:hypothetical protein
MLNEDAWLKGLPTCHKHAHMHTQSLPGINEETFTYVSESDGVGAELCKKVVEMVEESKIKQEFKLLEEEMHSNFQNVDAEYLVMYTFQLYSYVLSLPIVFVSILNILIPFHCA